MNSRMETIFLMLLILFIGALLGFFGLAALIVGPDNDPIIKLEFVCTKSHEEITEPSKDIKTIATWCDQYTRSKR